MYFLSLTETCVLPGFRLLLNYAFVILRTSSSLSPARSTTFDLQLCLPCCLLSALLSYWARLGRLCCACSYPTTARRLMTLAQSASLIAQSASLITLYQPSHIGSSVYLFAISKVPFWLVDDLVEDSVDMLMTLLKTVLMTLLKTVLTC